MPTLNSATVASNIAAQMEVENSKKLREAMELKESEFNAKFAKQADALKKAQLELNNQNSQLAALNDSKNLVKIQDIDITKVQGIHVWNHTKSGNKTFKTQKNFRKLKPRK